MPTKQCPVCLANGMNMMKAEVVQLANATTGDPEIINWTCGYCGNTDSDTIYMGSFGSENTKSMVNPPVEEEPEAPLAAAARPEPLKTAKKPPKPEPEPEVAPAEVTDEAK